MDQPVRGVRSRRLHWRIRAAPRVPRAVRAGATPNYDPRAARRLHAPLAEPLALVPGGKFARRRRVAPTWRAWPRTEVGGGINACPKVKPVSPATWTFRGVGK